MNAWVPRGSGQKQAESAQESGTQARPVDCPKPLGIEQLPRSLQGATQTLPAPTGCVSVDRKEQDFPFLSLPLWKHVGLALHAAAGPGDLFSGPDLWMLQASWLTLDRHLCFVCASFSTTGCL